MGVGEAARTEPEGGTSSASGTGPPESPGRRAGGCHRRRSPPETVCRRWPIRSGPTGGRPGSTGALGRPWRRHRRTAASKVGVSRESGKRRRCPTGWRSRLRRRSAPGAGSEGAPRPGGRLPRPPAPDRTVGSGCGFRHSAAREWSVPGPGLTARLRPRPQLPPTAPVPPPQAPGPTTRLPRCPLAAGGRAGAQL